MSSPSSGNCWEPELIHEGIETWDVTDRIKIIAHALVDLGRVTALECTYANCTMPSRAFGVKRERPAIDHIVSRRNGGSNRYNNLQIIHLGCNARKARFEDSGVPIGEFMEKIRGNYNFKTDHSAFMKAQWADPEIRAKRLATIRNQHTGKAQR